MPARVLATSRQYRQEGIMQPTDSRLIDRDGTWCRCVLAQRNHVVFSFVWRSDLQLLSIKLMLMLACMYMYMYPACTCTGKT